MPRLDHRPTERPDWDTWALGIAAAVSRRADCTRRQVGAVMLSPDHRIIATGYNGYPAGRPGCLTDGACPRGQMSFEEVAAYTGYVGTGAASCDALHAEENLVLESDRASRAGATVYVTDEPCANCTRVLAGSGVARVVWPEGSTTYDRKDTAA